MLPKLSALLRGRLVARPSREVYKYIFIYLYIHTYICIYVHIFQSLEKYVCMRWKPDMLPKLSALLRGRLVAGPSREVYLRHACVCACEYM